MNLPDAARREVDALPGPLRALLEAELAAGNSLVEVGHGFPAPPVGAYFKLKHALMSRPQKSGNGVVYYDRKGSTYSGEITDLQRHFFLLEPPHADVPEGVARRVGADAGELPVAPRRSGETTSPIERSPDKLVAPANGSATTSNSNPPTTGSERPWARFERSMVMDFDKWHDGTGYDLEALRTMSAAEKQGVEKLLLSQMTRGWRDIEALACLDTPAAREAVKAALRDPRVEVRNAASRFAPQLFSDEERTASLVKALESAVIYGGLTQTLAQIADFHPPAVVDALLRGTLQREGEVAVHLAAALFEVHGQPADLFDATQRPFFLRFKTEKREERVAVFRELCARLGLDAQRHLPRPVKDPGEPEVS